MPELSTSTALSGAGTYTSDWFDLSEHEGVMFSAFADVAGTLYAQFSATGTEEAGDSTPSSLTYNVAAGTNEVHRLAKTRTWFRIRYVNGSSAQSSFHIQCFVGLAPLLTSPHSGNVQQDADSIVVRSLPSDIELSSGKFAGHSIVNKFGLNNSVGTALTDIWFTGGVLTQATTAESLELFSSDANDTSAGSGAQKVTVYGLDANWAAQSVEVTMNGTATVAVTGTWRRVNRLRVTQRGTYVTKNAGTITCRVASGGATRLTIPIDATFGGYGSSLVSHYTIPASKTGYLKSMTIDVESAKPVNIYGLFRTNADDTSSPIVGEFYAPLIFRGIAGYEVRVFDNPIKLTEKTDIWFQAYATGATTGFVSVTYQIILVDN